MKKWEESEDEEETEKDNNKNKKKQPKIIFQKGMSFYISVSLIH